MQGVKAMSVEINQVQPSGGSTNICPVVGKLVDLSVGTGN